MITVTIVLVVLSLAVNAFAVFFVAKTSRINRARYAAITDDREHRDEMIREALAEYCALYDGAYGCSHTAAQIRTVGLACAMRDEYLVHCADRGVTP